MALKYAIVVDRHPEYGVKALPIDLNPQTCPPEKLAWSPVFSGPNERGRNYMPEIGQPVIIDDSHTMAGPSGSNFFPVLATYNPAINQQGGLQGNLNLIQLFEPFLNSIKNNVRLPPKAKETGKPTTRQRQETGDFKYSATKGMPAHVSIAQTFGMILPQVKNISTAIDQFTSVLTPGLLGAFPGLPLGNMLSSLSSNALFQTALGKLPTEVQQAFQSVQAFSRSVQGGSSYGFSLGSLVDEATFVNNAVNLLNNIKDPVELFAALQELQSNSSLHGCEKLQDTVIYLNNFNTVNANVSNANSIEIETEDANASNVIVVTVDDSLTISTNVTNSKIIITSCGKVESQDSGDVLETIKNVMSLLNTFASISSPSAGLGIGGMNNVAKKWADAQTRLPPQIQQMRQKLLKDISVAGGNLSNLAIAAQVAKRVFKLIP